MILALVPCGTTEWHDQGRLLGRVELPLSSAGQSQCEAWAGQLRALGLQRILHSSDELSAQTAAILSRALAVPTKGMDELAELDVGLWAGLTDAQLKARYASCYRELREAPLNVNPPGGESFVAARERVCSCIRKQIRKNGRTAIAVVLRPLALALARCALQGRDPTEIWDCVRAPAAPIVIDCSVTRPDA